MLYGEQSLPKDPSVFPSGGWGGGGGGVWDAPPFSPHQLKICSSPHLQKSLEQAAPHQIVIPPYQTYPTGLSTTYAINTNREAYIPHEPQNPHEGSSRSKIFEFSMRSRL